MKQGWESKKLGEVCDIFNGATPLRRQKEYWEDGVINWFTVEDIRQQGRIINHTNQKISQLGFDNTSIKLLPARSILLCCTASVGEYAITNIELTTNQQFNGLVVKDSEQLLPEYLFHFSSTLKSILLSVSGKTTIDFVSMTKLKNVEIPVPPLEEQKQIVAKLDQCFEAIDKAKANAAKNLENAKELFQSKLNDIFSQKGEDWVEKKLGDVCSLIGGGTPSKKNEQFYTGDILWATVRDMKLDVITHTECSITKEAVSKSSTNIIPKGNVIIATRVGLGKVCLINQDTAINQDLRGVIPKEKPGLQIKYLFWWFKSISKLIVNEGTGATVQGVKLPFVKSLNIPIPTTASQSSVIALLDTLKEQTQSLETKYQQELNSLEELKKSILQKAFEGEL